MLHVLYVAAAMMLTVGHDTKSASTMDATVAKTIESFEPFWKPPVGTLKGVTVVIDPVGGNAASAPERTCEDNNVLTASYLWHFIRKAGGEAIVGRLGDGPADLDQSGSVSPLEFARDPKRTAYVAIQFDRSATQAVYHFAFNDDPGANDDHGASGDDQNALLQSLIDAGALGQVTVERSNSLRAELTKGQGAISQFAAMTPSVCKIVLPCPERGNRREQRDRAVCRKAAQQLCEGLIRSFSKIVELPTSTSKIETLPDGFDRVGASRARSAARRIWPDGKLPHDKIEWFVGMYRRVALPNQSLCYFNVSVKQNEQGYQLEGSTNVPNVANGLLFALNEAGIERIQNNVRALPDSKNLNGKLYGVCSAGMVRSYDRPGSADGMTSRALQTQLLYGEALYLLDREGDFILAHAADGYWGWVPQSSVRMLDAKEFHHYRSYPRGAVVVDIEFESLRVPRGASLPLAGKSEGRTQVLLPTGELFPVASSSLRTEHANDDRGEERVRAALDLLQTPYLFGGRSPLGLDCSGLMTNVCERVNLPVARDAWQQAIAGELTATSWDRTGVEPGDQIFFMDSSGKIYHTGIAISNDHVLHAAPPGVQIGSLKEGDRLFDARLHRDFFVAKRP